MEVGESGEGRGMGSIEEGRGGKMRRGREREREAFFTIFGFFGARVKMVEGWLFKCLILNVWV